jgi:tRNA-specific 2-thiouridylase
MHPDDVVPGFDAVCTGHYARVVDGRLLRAADPDKDQSYVLGVLNAQQLAHTSFPLGSTPSKAIVRAEAAQRGISVAQKPDSHDICFIPDGDTRGWLAEKVGAEQGDVVDRTGAVIGTHEGAHAFTVGQRRGLRLGVPAPDGKPRFVLEVRPVSNTVVVGPKEALATAEISGEKHSWAGAAPQESEFACEVQIRAHADPVQARAFVTDAGVRVAPDVPLDGVAPGQSAVLYIGTHVLGQFTIDTTVSAVPVGA